MEQLYITNIKIKKVRHLRDIDIPISYNQKKHLILTGRNGSGKTSVLDALARYLNALVSSQDMQKAVNRLARYKKIIEALQTEGEPTEETERQILWFEKTMDDNDDNIDVELCQPSADLRFHFEKGEFVVAYYKADRVFQVTVPRHIEHVELKDSYTMTESPRKEFAKYLTDLRFKQLSAKDRGDVEKADRIRHWFEKLEELLRIIFEDEALQMSFEEEGYFFRILETGKEPFDFNTLSGGYAAVLDIVVDLILRMEKQTDRSFEFDVPGIVLIDEIETHLHLKLQRNILRLLTTLFPGVQFIMSTHSPFILNSIDNVVIYDLEKKLLVKDGLSNYTYTGIVEGYYQSSELSEELERKFQRYKELVKRTSLTDEDIEEITELEMYLEEIPDYLALEVSTEYQRLKLEFMDREDV